MPERPHIDNDIHVLRAAVTQFGLIMNHPRSREYLGQHSGVDLDKVGEVLLMITSQSSCGDIRLSEVAHRLGVELSSVSRKVQKLEDLGYLSRTSDPQDGRASRICVTPAGKAVLDKVAAARHNLIKEALADWSDAERNDFCAGMQKFVTSIDNHLEIWSKK